MIKVDALLEIVDAVEVVEQRQLRLLLAYFRRVAQILDERLRVNLLLDIDGNDGYLEVARVLLVLALPHELRIERRVARIPHLRGRLLVLLDEAAQLLRRNVRPRVL